MSTDITHVHVLRHLPRLLPRLTLSVTSALLLKQRADWMVSSAGNSSIAAPQSRGLDNLGCNVQSAIIR